MIPEGWVTLYTGPNRGAAAIRDLRASLGMTQGEAAKALGVSLRTFHAWERGERATPKMAILALRYLQTRDEP